MLFWIAIAALTAAATAALLAPLFRARRVTDEAESEIAIYRDQLEEIERDVARGVLPGSEAKAARTEIARRLIHASDTSGRQSAEQPARRRIAFWLALVAVPAICLGGYLALGSPGTGDRPFGARVANPDPSDVFLVQQLVGAVLQSPAGVNIGGLRQLVDEAIEINPDHPALWEALAFVAAMQGSGDDVIRAYDRYVELRGTAGGDAEQLAVELAQFVFLLTQNAAEPVGMLADRALALNPVNRGAQLMKGLALTEAALTEAAIAHWEAMLAEEPVGGADWADIARSQLTALGVEPPPPPEEAPAFEGLTPEQLEMVNQMVGNLAARLDENPDDVEGWAQLIRSYMVLEREEEAFAALATAREFFTGNAEAMAVIEEVEAELARAMELE